MIASARSKPDHRSENQSIDPQMLAVGALLAYVANVDDSFDDEEFEAIVHLLQKRFEISEDAAYTVLESAIRTAQSEEEIGRIIDGINETKTARAREKILAGVCSVILADGIELDVEFAQVQQIGSRMLLSKSEIQRAWHAAKSGRN